MNNTVTCVAPVNIAVIKYWGKRDEILILPYNDSISLSLHTDQLCTKTTVMISKDFKKNCIWLNGVKERMDNSRLESCLGEIIKKSNLSQEMLSWKLHICSENNFPTAAGLASSAAGFACLTAALAKLYQVKDDISSIARLGSGSACRSTLGGFVKWTKGVFDNGCDSSAVTIENASHWPEMRCLILVVDDNKKKVSSAVGMQRTAETSYLFFYRINYAMLERVKLMEKAISNKNFDEFAKLTMKDSNQLHAVCLDSYPPLMYMNDTSFAIVNLIHSYHDVTNSIKVAYTFDAGPNATLFLLEKDVPEVVALLDHYFPPASNNLDNYKRGMPIETANLSENLLKKIDSKVQEPGKIKYMIYTRVGDGPKFLLDPKDCLLNNEGLPKRNVTV